MKRQIFSLASIGILAFVTCLSVCCFSAVEEDSADLSLLTAIREVAKETNVLPLDVYAGTTLNDFRNWNCRYDLTYKEFRLNYFLCLSARNASINEILKCVEELHKMKPKEKALTCAALIAFIRAQREREADCLTQILSNGETTTNSSLNDDEKKLVLQKLRKELKDQQTAFSKVADSGLSSIWERNLREECGNFMSLQNDDITATRACWDLYVFLRDDSDSYPSPFATWNNDTKQLPMDFLCALVLAQAAYSQELWENKIAENKGSAEGAPFYERLENAKRDAVEKCFCYCKTSVFNELDSSLSIRDRPTKRPADDGECLIMNAYLRTQFIDSRLGIQEGKGTICGNSSSKDVLVSEVVQKAVEAVLNSSSSFITERNLKSNEECKGEEKSSRPSLLRSIQDNADTSVFFSLPLFIKMFETLEQKKKDRDLSYVRLPVTYERSRPFCMIYEVAKNASRDEIVECLATFNDLSNKEKAFVLAAAALYIVRSESPCELKSALNEKELEPLSIEEKTLFAQLVKDNEKKVIVFESLGRTTVEEWKSCFRKEALEFQKTIGKWNPYYNYSKDTETLWSCFCTETPVVILYSMLAMETYCGLDDLRDLPETKDVQESRSEKKEGSAWTRRIEKEDDLAEIRLLRDYLFLISEVARRKPLESVAGYSAFPPSPKFYDCCASVRWSDIVQQIFDRFPTMKTGGLPDLNFSGNSMSIGSETLH